MKRKYCGRWLREQWYSGQSELGRLATSLLGSRLFTGSFPLARLGNLRELLLHPNCTQIAQVGFCNFPFAATSRA